MKQEKNEILNALGHHKKSFFTVALLSFAINTLYLTPSIYMMQVYDRIMSSRSESTLVFLTLLVVGIYLMMSLLDYFRVKILVRVSNALDQQLSKRVFNAMFGANILSNSTRRSSSALNDFTTIRQFVTGTGVTTLFDLPWAPVYLGVIFLMHYVLGIVATIGIALLIAITLIANRITQAKLLAANQAASQASIYANSNLRNAEVISSMGMFDNFQNRWATINKKMLIEQTEASDTSAGLSGVAKFIRLTIQSSMLAIGMVLYLEGEATGGIMIAASILIGRATQPIELITGSWRNYVVAYDAYKRLSALLNEFPSESTKVSLPRPKGLLTLENLVVSPPGSREPVIKGVSLKINPGDIVGVVGPSGSGKSTLVRAMVGVWKPSSGIVRLDAADIFSWPKSELGQYLGYLPQDVELFSGTVAENIARFSEVNSELVVEAAMKSGIHEMVLRLPEGYETQIGDLGASLSGGQRQRIALARAFYNNPVLYVLDEPNSNLDESGEASLLTAITNLKQQGHTVILVTHRPNILHVVDKLMVVTAGRLQAYGPKELVMQEMSNQKKNIAK